MDHFCIFFPYQQTQIQAITNGKKEISSRIDSSDHLYVGLIRCGSRGAGPGSSLPQKKKKKGGGGERERREKKRGKRKRDINETKSS